MIDKWNCVYFICIVLMFYNYDILYELIKLNVDVNEKIFDGWILLILVFGNDIEINEELFEEIFN